MESGNSSSMQSSSGGDDQEYESSGGLNIAGSSSNYYTTTNVDSNNNITQPSQYNNPTMFMLSSAQTQPQPPLLPPLQSNYLDAFESHSNYQNLMFWQPQQFGTSGGGSGGGGSGSGSGGVGLSDHPSVNNPTGLLSAHGSGASGASPGAKPSTSQHTGAGAGAGAGVSGGTGKNPRKRTRASRRAPTTVLTTDTSNFRAMVQEFTGIPSSPFSAAASPLLSRRLTDLLSGTSSSPGPSLRPGPPPPMGVVGPSTSSLERLLAGYNNNTSISYPLRPSAHKLNTTTDTCLQSIQTSSDTGTVSPLSNLSFQSILQSSGAPSSLRYPTPPSVASLLTPNVGNFQDLSGVLGSEPVFGFAPMRLAPDSGSWRGGSSSNIEEGGEGNNSSNNNNNNNQQMEGSISGSGTSNYNVNMNCSRDKGLDSSTPTKSGSQGTLGDFLG